MMALGLLMRFLRGAKTSQLILMVIMLTVGLIVPASAQSSQVGSYSGLQVGRDANLDCSSTCGTRAGGSGWYEAFILFSPYDPARPDTLALGSEDGGSLGVQNCRSNTLNWNIYNSDKPTWVDFSESSGSVTDSCEIENLSMYVIWTFSPCIQLFAPFKSSGSSLFVTMLKLRKPHKKPSSSLKHFL